MQMLSYRGPNAAGGVSSALSQVFAKENCKNWWYLKDEQLTIQSARGLQQIHSFSAQVREGHYQYCNNFLWPVLHDLPQYAHYSDSEHKLYLEFNAVAAACIRESQASSDIWFVNDYQFAVMPQMVQNSADSILFWHIPWPKDVIDEHVAPLTELALGLLSSRVVGFHTSEYLDNFFNFVQRYLSGFKVDFQRKLIGSTFAQSEQALSTATRFTVAPLGVDLSHWKELSRRSGGEVNLQLKLPYVLSVDRCDYTKGLSERLVAIDLFFERHSQWRESVHFLQIGSRSRPGLAEFDAYWQLCMQQVERINARWGTPDWTPVIWFENSLGSEGLAQLYAKADLMLVNSLRDGLNLTAKEFVACQHARPGILGLSRGTGAWHELHGGCVTVDPAQAEAFADSIHSCLLMEETERYRRNHKLRACLETNLIVNWWQNLVRQYVPSVAVTEQVCS